jgi:hypothetical protein
MKILSFRRLVGLAALGGFAYIHKQRNGEWTMASMKDTLRHIWSSASERAGQVREAPREGMQRSTRAADTSTRGGMSESRGSQVYGYGGVRDDETGRH